MPIDYRLYPKGWRTFSSQIRFARAASQCECRGQCGLHGGPHGNRRCMERHHEPALWAKGTIRLTVAHLCSCNPPCDIPSHVLACCQRCHLRIDRFRHAKTRLTRLRARRAIQPPNYQIPPDPPLAI